MKTLTFAAAGVIGAFLSVATADELAPVTLGLAARANSVEVSFVSPGPWRLEASRDLRAWAVFYSGPGSPQRARISLDTAHATGFFRLVTGPGANAGADGDCHRGDGDRDGDDQRKKKPKHDKGPETPVRAAHD
jgi:hypothetical protein